MYVYIQTDSITRSHLLIHFLEVIAAEVVSWRVWRQQIFPGSIITWCIGQGRRLQLSSEL